MSTLTISYTETEFPPGTNALAATAITLTGATVGVLPPVPVPVGTTSVSVALVADSYTWSMQSTDAEGNDLGEPFTGTFSVAAPANVTINLPSGITAS
jgi:hypothetical protein